MSITVADCLKIGVLREAEVVAGAKGLDRAVESVSVLEFNGFEVEGLGAGVFKGNEMLLSAFSCFKDHSTDITTIAGKLIHSGVSCFVIVYLGMLFDNIPVGLLQLAEQLNVPVIILPRKTRYAYTDVIMPVTEAIIRDRRTSIMFVSDILNQLTCVDEEQQNIHTLLELLRKQVGADLILADTVLNPLDWALEETAQPPAEILEKAWSAVRYQLPLNPRILTLPEHPPLHIRFQPIRTNKLVGMLLAIKRTDSEFDIDVMTQAAEVMRLFLGVWRVTRSRLSKLDALLEGGASGGLEKRIRHLAVIRAAGGAPLDSVLDELTIVNLLAPNRLRLGSGHSVTFFNGSIVIASHMPDIHGQEALSQIQKSLNRSIPLYLGESDINPEQTVQQVYTLIVSALPTALRLFPHASRLQPERIAFAAELSRIREQLGSHSDTLLAVLAPLRLDERWNKFHITLDTLYLDCNGSMQEAADCLGLHVNTLKYRVGIVSQIIGLDLSTALNSTRIILALALLRLLG